MSAIQFQVSPPARLADRRWSLIPLKALLLVAMLDVLVIPLADGADRLDTITVTHREPSLFTHGAATTFAVGVQRNSFGDFRDNPGEHVDVANAEDPGREKIPVY